MFYQEPDHLLPRDLDHETGKPTDHWTIWLKAINVINNTPLRKYRTITRRPITDSGLKLFRVWVKNQDWQDIKEAHDINNKAKVCNKMLLKNFYYFFLIKASNVSTYNSPWWNEKVKHLKQQKCCEFNKHQSSDKWNKLNKIYKTAVISAKKIL